MPPRSIRERLSAAAKTGLGVAGKGTTSAAATAQSKELLELGITAVNFASTDQELAQYTDRLWNDQNDPLADRMKEWMQIEYYVANEQFLAYHRGRREWLPRKAVPWRIRSTYNICGKCVELRVQRLTENKPTVSVQAATVDMDDVHKAEYKQTLFWGLWEKLSLHKRIVGTRTDATLNGSGFLKVGWDADAGTEIPSTRKKPAYKTVDLPATDPATGQPVTDPNTGQPALQPQQVFAGLEEVYLDKNGQELGPVESMVPDEDNPGHMKKVRNPVPDNCDLYAEGEVFVDERRAANIRWDRYVDDIDESWYVQDSEILPGFKIAAMFPDSIEKLKKASPASQWDKLQFQAALDARDPLIANIVDRSRPSDSQGSPNQLDSEYVVRETWFYPVNSLMKKLWGADGCKVVTVGGVVIAKSALPEWAKKKRNFVRFIDIPEKGNHYGKSALRDVLPMQDDINRSRSMMAERLAIESRLILGAPQGHGMNLRLLGGMPGVLLTYRSKDHQPQPIDLAQQGEGADAFYQASLQGAADLGNMNDASTGKLPSAGIAAKAIYALQYADERSITKTSTLQDESLKKLAFAIDAVTRIEYKESRKVRVAGEDRDFLIESEVLPDHLETDIDYYFTPGSMLSKQKEAVRNEMIALMNEGLIDKATARKFIAPGVPDVFRQSNDLHEAKARRNLEDILRRGEQVTADPWDDPTVHLGVYQEYMLTRKWKVTGEEEQKAIIQLWQSFRLMLQQQQPEQGGGEKGPSESINFKDLPPDGQQQMAAQAGITISAESADANSVPGAPGGPAAPPVPAGGHRANARRAGAGADTSSPMAQGARQLEQRATQTVAPPNAGRPKPFGG